MAPAHPRQPLAVGNWKMHGLKASLVEAKRVCDWLRSASFAGGVEAMICPPATLIYA